MRSDGDPDPDDYGLPRVDIVVPDDARELDRDVLAYRREERRRRRRARLRRITGPFTRFGIAVPLIAGALLVALVSGVLMTAFGPQPAPRPTTARLAPNPTASAGREGGLLPAGTVTMADGTAKPTREMRPGVIGIVPPGFRCGALIAELAAQTAAPRLNFWLVADPRPADGREPVAVKDVKKCAGTAHQGAPLVVEDERGLLAAAYAPEPGTALTAVLVKPDGIVADVVPDPNPGTDLNQKIKDLTVG
ncbi:hypothetical protein [Actinomadura sp. WMMB 499]|uniref:hypothetical protein n=1 Tax=Actinomadura sp. WMMB 499 TaxID=1219491 RepID=UPI001244D740|nr:hypothetical protein [Actinomadura sp. WMMB 499]QFG21975.1 hypothetical protein F7P10_13450 [Actinomadura sp. WMMB 499]